MYIDPIFALTHECIIIVMLSYVSVALHSVFPLYTYFRFSFSYLQGIGFIST